jgi:hypothetical protein
MRMEKIILLEHSQAVLITKCYYNDEMKYDEMDGTYSMHGGN